MPDVLIVADTVRSPELRQRVRRRAAGGSVPLRRGGGHPIRRRQLVRVGSGRGARGRGSRCSRSRTSASTSCSSAGSTCTSTSASSTSAPAGSSGSRAPSPPRHVPGRASPTTCEGTGSSLTPDQRAFDERRRVKTERELEGIRRACRAVEAGIAAGVTLLARLQLERGADARRRAAQVRERVKPRSSVFGEHGAAAEEFIVSHGAQTAVGHDGGSGPIATDDFVLFDSSSRATASRPATPTSREPLRSGPPWTSYGSTTGWRRRRSTSPSPRSCRAKGSDIHRQVCDFFHEHGYKTQLHKAEASCSSTATSTRPGTASGLEVHEHRVSAGRERAARRRRRDRARARALPRRFRRRPAR